jgi:hypothetical protein
MLDGKIHSQFCTCATPTALIAVGVMFVVGTRSRRRTILMASETESAMAGRSPTA